MAIRKAGFTITVESFSMETASPTNASDRLKDGQRRKYCEREPLLIQGGHKQFLNLCRTDLGQHCSNIHQLNSHFWLKSSSAIKIHNF